MEIKTFKIFSYCDDFTEEEQEWFPEEITCATYITITAGKLEGDPSGLDYIAAKLLELGADQGEDVLIHIDY